MSKTRTSQQGTPKTAGQWIVQIIGEIFITVGLLLLLFVAWQLWWTNIEANNAQKNAVDSLVQEFKAASGEPLTQGENGGDSVGEDNSAQDDLPRRLQPGEWDPNTPPSGLQEPAYGTTFGIVYIPRLGENYQRPATEGTGTDVLDTLGLGHYEGSAMPGQVGNFALAGHRQTNGAVLDRVEELQKGDRVYVQTIDGYYTYTIYETKIVEPTQVDVIAPNPDDPTGEAKERLLTLTTCHPRYGDSHRYIVHASMSSWQPLAAGAPDEIAVAVANQ